MLRTTSKCMSSEERGQKGGTKKVEEGHTQHSKTEFTLIPSLLLKAARPTGCRHLKVRQLRGC